MSRRRCLEALQKALVLLIVLSSGVAAASMAQAAAQPETVTVTLVRWPYT